MDAKELLQRKNAFDGNLVMGSHLFNTLTKRDTHVESVAKRKKILINPESGQLKNDLVIQRVCPLCSSSEADLLFNKEGFPHHRCKSCEMVYVSPILKNDSLNALYQNEDTYSQVLESETQVRMDELKFDLFLDLIEEQCPDRGNILDIGCGPGLFLTLAKKRGWSVTGCEVNKMAINRLKEAGIPVIDRPVEECHLEKGSFQCITLLTVLEHIPDPKGLLKKIRTLLQPGGIVAILVPNVNALANRILHEKSTTFSGDMHINHFSDITLGNMLEATGFDVIVSETILTNIDSINNYLNYEDLVYGSRRQGMSILTPEYIHKNKMGYLLFTLAKAR